MSLHDDLRRQAWHLATWEPGRPSQASLRRAVSTGYYALFHLLIDESTAQVLGRQASRRRPRNVIARGYSHTAMVAACKAFGSGTLPAIFTRVLGPVAVPGDLRDVAATFVKLQEARHRADYSLGEPFRRSEVRAHLNELDTAFDAWRRVRSHETARLFLAALPLWEQLRR